jgi:hypothetical protein
MNTNSQENLCWYEKTILLNQNNTIDTNNFANILQTESVSFDIIVNDEPENTVNSIDALIEHLNNDKISDDEEVKIRARVDKSNLKTFTIFDETVFTDYLATLHPEDFLYEIHKSLVLKNNKLRIEQTNTEIDYKRNDLDGFQTIPLNKMEKLSKLIEEKINPDDIYQIALQLQEPLKSCFIEKSTISMLFFLANDFDADNKNYYFYGYRDYCIHIENLPEENCDIVRTLFQFIYSTKEFVAKLGILRNIISISDSSKKFEDIFNQKLRVTLFSNYQIYLKDNVERYIDVKNKTSDFIFELSNRVIDSIDSYKTDIKRAIMAIMSFYFMSVVFTGIDKGKFESLYRIDIGILSVVFLIFAIVYICISNFELKNRINTHRNGLDQLKERYTDILNQEDLDGIFDKTTIDCIEKDNSTKSITILGISFCVILISITMAMVYSKNTILIDTYISNTLDNLRLVLNNSLNS